MCNLKPYSTYTLKTASLAQLLHQREPVRTELRQTATDHQTTGTTNIMWILPQLETLMMPDLAK